VQFASKLYWEQSPTFSVPVLLLLDGDDVELVADSGVVLRCPASELVVHVALGRFTLEHGEDGFRLTATEGRSTPPMMPETTRRLRRFVASHPGMPPASVRLTRQWRGYLEGAGAEVRGPSARKLTVWTVGMIAAPLIVLALVFVAYLAGLRP